MQKTTIKKGDVVWVEYDPSIGTEIQKKRPSVVLSNDVVNKNHTRILVAPITSKVNKVYPFEYEIVDTSKVTGKVMLDQMRFIDRMRLGSKVTTLADAELLPIQEIVKYLLGV